MPSKKESVAMSSVLAGAALTITKLIVGVLTGSMGIISEAAHSLLDLGAAGLTYFAVHFGDQPADKTHTYGHGKIESVSALIETGLLFITSGWIIYEAIHRLLSGNIEVEATWYAFAVMFFSIIIDISRSRALYKVAKKTKSQALEADALHFHSDIYSSSVVLIGLVCVAFNIKGADAVAAMVVAVFVSVAGWRLGKRTLDILLDAAPQGISDEAKEIALQVNGVIEVERIRVRPLGPNVFIEMVVHVSRKLSVASAHEITEQIKAKIIAKIPEADMLIHTKSVQLSGETAVEAVQALAAKNNFTVHDVVVDSLDDKQFISYDLEVPDTFTVKEAHLASVTLEQEIKKDLGDDVEINSHIEPLKNDAILSSNVNPDEMEKVLDAINKTDKKVVDIANLHDILVRKIGEKFLVSLHCQALAEMSIETVHNATSRFEYLARAEMPAIKRVVIHVEPKK
ncbi:MAG: cation diffusion facilitator family transporter [Candidatus Komeilibacteria bacterium]|nr:cation diffusion facilitator family transporter [Candidatus Komeilibacteria bacterium]